MPAALPEGTACKVLWAVDTNRNPVGVEACSAEFIRFLPARDCAYRVLVRSHTPRGGIVTVPAHPRSVSFEVMA
jgi:hypothetical protein